MAELADAPGLGSGVLRDVGVRGPWRVRGEALASAAQVVGREKQGFGTLPAPLGAGAESQGREQRTPYLGSALS